MANENKFTQNSSAEASSLDSTLNALLYKLQNKPQQLAEIKNECDLVNKYLSPSSPCVNKEKLRQLIPFIGKSDNDVKEILFALLEDLIFKLDDPNEFLSELLLSREEHSQQLAARLLDLKAIPVSEQSVKKLLSNEAAEILSDYLAYTRASYQDLLLLVPDSAESTLIIESIKECEKICSRSVISEVITKLGWKAINYGLFAKRYIGVSVDGSLPFYLSESEAILFEKSEKANRVSDYYLFTACGGMPNDTSTSAVKNEKVSLFRAYNLAHANLLQQILDVAPLTNQKVHNIIRQMNQIVDDFTKLFDSFSEECKILPDIYGRIKDKIIRGLDSNPEASHLSADVTRLVQMFEDPKSIGEVHTLHGLKRYLHQRGLQLGFKLVDQSKSPNQSISVELVSGNKILSVIKNINYADFESQTGEKLTYQKIPYPIQAVIDGFKRQMLHGHENFPSVNIFCYGNEVHYFVWFRNHPVFIRIDFSLPLQGGMIDLQYFGVSNYEVADHPNIYLDAIRYFFRHLEFDVKMEGTHIQARYDKERALDLSQLCERVEYLFCLAPYLMDLDWVIGSLDLGPDAKKKVAKAWAEIFSRWGVLPINKFLTQDRLSILQDVLITPEGEYELKWAGDSDYRDQYTLQTPSDFFKSIFDSLDNLYLNIPKFSKEDFVQPGQLILEKKFLYNLRESVSVGEVIETETGFQRASEKIFKKVHEASRFAQIICEAKEEFESSVALAKSVIPLEQILKFRDTGTFENFKIQSALIPLSGDSAKLFVLRDTTGIIRMAFFVHGNILFEKWISSDSCWRTNSSTSAVEFISLLRRNNYTITGALPSIDSLKEEIKKIKDELLSRQKLVMQIRTAGEKIVKGLRASPGRATGRVLLGVEGRLPEDFDDQIFVASSVSPDENTILFHSAGIVATGGGILSHAGLIATQFNKPAIIISGKWKQEAEGSLILLYHTSEYQVHNKTEEGFNVSIFQDLHENEHELRDGDLVVLDANEGSLEVLGQETDTIALFEGLKALGRINEGISGVSNFEELLVLRGKKLHTRHQIEKIINRISDPLLVKYLVREILVGKFLEGNKSTPEEKAYLIKVILLNGTVRHSATIYLAETAAEIEAKFINACNTAENYIPLANFPFEVVMPRLDAFRIYQTMTSVNSSLITAQLQTKSIETKKTENINSLSIDRLEELRTKLREKVEKFSGHADKKEFLRHLFRQLKRVNLLLNEQEIVKPRMKKLYSDFEISDRKLCEGLEDKYIIKPSEGAIELVSLIGWKAANLSELELLSGERLVPDWFVISDKAFQNVLNTPIEHNLKISGEYPGNGIILREAIDGIILRTDINNREKSSYIRSLWSSVVIPDEIKEEVIQAYREIEKEFLSETTAKEKEAGFYVALRSSSCKEDAEIAARAGEFETYLFITGEDLLIDYLKKTWSGLWTERAIHNRNVLGNHEIKTKGGVIVQRIVWSRVSGVLQTINVAKGNLNEIVINAGLGLGEGVVSGTVAADQIIVSKEGDLEKDPLHFNYITADKTEQVVFNKKTGFGTILSPTLYHQRFRPALDYVELCELVSVASRLEAAYGYPLDIEFGIEDTRLWILQVRPVATFLPALKETLDYYPLFKKKTGTT